MISLTLIAIIQIFGFFALGIIAKLKGYVKDESIDDWSRFAIDFLYPFFIFDTITRGLKRESLAELWPLPIIGLGLITIGLLIGVILQFGLGKNPDKDIQKTFLHFCAINNSAYLPVIIVSSLWGATGVANLFLLNLGSQFGYWTIGVSLLKGGSIKDNVKKLLSPNLLSVILSITIVLLGIYDSIPEIILKVIHGTGVIAIPLILIIIGATLLNKQGFKYKWPVIYVTTIRLTIIPAISIVLLKLLPISKDVFHVSMMVALMPIAVSSVLLTRRFGGSTEYASATALVSTIASAISIPVALWIIL
jgi:predicted permease